MSKNKDIIVLNGVEYMPLSMATQNAKALDLKGMAYCIVRTYSAGVFAAYVEKEWTENFVKCALLQKSRRLWYWDGAASLSQLAVEGVKKPENCKFPCEINDHKVYNVIEVIPCTQLAQESINSVSIWKQ